MSAAAATRIGTALAFKPSCVTALPSVSGPRSLLSITS